MGLGMRASWVDIKQAGGQERNGLRGRKNGRSYRLRAKKVGHVEKIGTEVRSPSPTEVGQLVGVCDVLITVVATYTHPFLFCRATQLFAALDGRNVIRDSGTRTTQN